MRRCWFFLLLFATIAAAQELPSEKELNRRITRMEEHTRDNPRDTGAWHDLADLYREAARWDDAIAADSKAIEHFPNFAIAWYGRAKAKMGKKEFAAAREDFDHAIGLWEKRGGLKIYLELERPPDAYIDSYRTRGMARANQGDYPGGIADVSTAILLKKDDPKLYYERGYLEEKAGKAKEAIADYKQAALVYFDFGMSREVETCLTALGRLKAEKEIAEVRQRMAEKKRGSDLPD
jgi:tetratricopeptide (TPR) repeat protein